jgi:hypothetical protein
LTREGAARVALLAYPPAARAAHGDEIAATLLDASAGSGLRFARELLDLVRLGLRARATQTARASAGRLVADGLCLAAIWIMTLDLSTLLSQKYRGMGDALLMWPSIALLAAVLALALSGLDRLAGAGALVWTSLRLPELLDRHPGIGGLAPEVLPVLCFAALMIVPRRRSPDARRMAWLVVPAVLVALFGPRGNGQNPALVAAVLLGVVLVVALAVALLPKDPRLAIAGAVPLSDLAIAFMSSHDQTPLLMWLWLGAAPAVVAVALTRPRRPQRL